MVKKLFLLLGAKTQIFKITLHEVFKSSCHSHKRSGLLKYINENEAIILAEKQQCKMPRVGLCPGLPNDLYNSVESYSTFFGC